MKPIRIGALVGSGMLLSLGVIFVPGCSDSKTGTDGGGTDTGTGTETGGGDGGGMCSTTVSCANYCAQLKTSCSGANVQLDEATCKCGMWSAGKPTDTAGDTLGCREYHLGVATTSAANATMHCPHTGNGPADGGGNPVCK